MRLVLYLLTIFPTFLLQNSGFRKTSILFYLVAVWSQLESVSEGFPSYSLMILDVACCYLWLFSLYVNINTCIGKIRGVLWAPPPLHQIGKIVVKC